MESNGKTGFKWFLIFLGIVTCVGGLIALATVIVNNGVSTEEALGDNDRYVRSDVKSEESKRGTEIYNENQISSDEIPYESNIFEDSKVDSSVEDGKYDSDSYKDLYQSLGDGYEDVIPEAVSMNDKGEILIYGQVRDVWDFAKEKNNETSKIGIKSKYYMMNMMKLEETGDLKVDFVNKSVYMLSTELSPYKDTIMDATYEVKEGKDASGNTIYYVTFLFNDGLKVSLEYGSQAKTPFYILKNKKFEDVERKYYGYVISNGSGMFKDDIVDDMYVIGLV